MLQVQIYGLTKFAAGPFCLITPMFAEGNERQIPGSLVERRLHIPGLRNHPLTFEFPPFRARLLSMYFCTLRLGAYAPSSDVRIDVDESVLIVRDL